MQILLETQNVSIPGNSRGALSVRIERAMSHMQSKVSSLHLSLRDINGAKGGRDKLCTVRAQLVDGGEIVVVNRAHGVNKGMFGALRKCRQLVAQELKRRRQRGRKHSVEPTIDAEPELV